MVQTREYGVVDRETSSFAPSSQPDKELSLSAMEDAIKSGDASFDQRSKGKSIILMTALCLAIFLAALDGVIITTALPTIAVQFSISDSGYAWIGSAYLLANAVSIVIWTMWSNIFGRKRILLIANYVFMVGSVVSALSQNLTMLIAGRAVQGIGGGGIICLVNITISDLFCLRYVEEPAKESHV
jgi:predicted MFS family arabinose efflux permease